MCDGAGLGCSPSLGCRWWLRKYNHALGITEASRFVSYDGTGLPRASSPLFSLCADAAHNTPLPPSPSVRFAPSSVCFAPPGLRLALASPHHAPCSPPARSMRARGAWHSLGLGSDYTELRTAFFTLYPLHFLFLGFIRRLALRYSRSSPGNVYVYAKCVCVCIYSRTYAARSRDSLTQRARPKLSISIYLSQSP